MDPMLLHGKKAASGAPGDLVSLSRVHKVYGAGLTGVHALHDVDLQVGTGEMVVVCGPCGSGKTSLLNVAGLLDTATEGNVVIASLLVSRLSEQARADLRGEMIGFIFQSFNLIPVLTARENVLLPLLLRGHLEQAELLAAHERADALLAQVGLSTQSAHYPPRLDASACQRVAIARALLTRPRLVIADEPTSRLDNGNIRLVMDLFARQQQEQGTAFLISTRDQRQLSRANRTLQLSDGRLQGAPSPGARRPLRVQL
ncbi:MAG TPA: ABC transporter ATP-binding protein [Telluria sp.]|nr:ABC transporter ATP-binding protein [Telluria sp.]